MMVFKMYLLSNMASFWVSMLGFGGVYPFFRFITRLGPWHHPGGWMDLKRDSYHGI